MKYTIFPCLWINFVNSPNTSTNVHTQKKKKKKKETWQSFHTDTITTIFCTAIDEIIKLECIVTTMMGMIQEYSMYNLYTIYIQFIYSLSRK